MGAPTYWNPTPYDGYVSMIGIAYVFRKSDSSYWNLEGSFTPTRGDISQALGTSVWLSGNGSVLAVSVPFDSSASKMFNGDELSIHLKDSGAAILYTRALNGVWTKALYVKAPVPGLQAEFGYVVGSDDASTIAIGSPYEAGRARGINGDQSWKSIVGDEGAAYIYQFSLCPPGFVGTLRSGCIDVNECLVNNGDCDPLTSCINVIGSRICGPCPSGYESGNGETNCVDINECAMNNGGCDPRTTCLNLPGTFECGPCPLGFAGNATSGCVATTNGFSSDLGDEITPLIEKVIILGNASVSATSFLTANFSLFIENGSLNVEGGVSFGPWSYTRIDGNFTLSGAVFFHFGAVVEITGSFQVAASASISLLVDEDPGNVFNITATVVHFIGDGTLVFPGQQSRSLVRSLLDSNFANSDCYTLGSSFFTISSNRLSISRNLSNTCFSGACLENNGGCDVHTSCFVRENKVVCGNCPPGFNGTGETSCNDIDECASNNGGCDNLTTCFNTPGSRECGPCPSGYSGTGLQGCEDVNECATSFGGCDPLTSCINLPGTSECGPCPFGYSGTGQGGCVDINECEYLNGGCDALTNCTNTIGSFLCGACPAGYSGSGRSGCADINECESDNGGCDPLALCTNIPGSRLCGPCPPGYSGTGFSSCVDIDECATDGAGCMRRCVNLPGSFECLPCPLGFKPSSLPGCVDENECATNNGGCPELCTNVVGSFFCSSCAEGYTGVGCQDIDECATNNGGCAQLCVNHPGSFSCTLCGQGLSWNGTGCDDVNECLTNNGGCDLLKNCSNSFGSFSCGSCPSGYQEGINSSCVDIDECASGNGGCDALTTCVNTPGSFVCGTCPSGYYPGTGKTPCLRILPCFSGQTPTLTVSSMCPFSPPGISVGGAGSAPVYSLSDIFESINIYSANGTMWSFGFLPHGRQLNFTKGLALDAGRGLLYVLFSNELCRVNVPDWTASMCYNLNGTIGQTDIVLDPSGQIAYILGSSNPYLITNGLIQAVNATSGAVLARGTNTSLSSYVKMDFDSVRQRLVVLDGNGVQLFDPFSLQKVATLGNLSLSGTVSDFALASGANLIFYATANFVHVAFGNNNSYWTSFGGPGISSSRFALPSSIWVAQENGTHVLVSLTSKVMTTTTFDHHVIRTWAFDLISGVATISSIRGPVARPELPLCSGASWDKNSGTLWCSSTFDFNTGSVHEWNVNGKDLSLIREYGVQKLSNFNLSTTNFPVIFDSIYSLGVSSSKMVVGTKVSALILDKVNPNTTLSSLPGGPYLALKVWTESSGAETVTLLQGSGLFLRRFDLSSPQTVINRSIFAWPNRTEPSLYVSSTSAAIDIRIEDNSTYMYVSTDSGIYKFSYNVTGTTLTILRRWTFAPYCFASSIVAPPVPNSPVWYVDYCSKTVNILSDNGQLTQTVSGAAVLSWNSVNGASPELVFANSSVLVLQAGVVKVFSVDGTFLETRGQRFGSMRRAAIQGQIDVISGPNNQGPNFVMSVDKDAVYVSSNSARVDKFSKADLQPMGTFFLQNLTSTRPSSVQDGIATIGSVTSIDGKVALQMTLARIDLTTLSVLEVIGSNSSFFGMISSTNSIQLFASASSTNGCLWVFAQNSTSSGYFRAYRLSPDRSVSLGFANFSWAYLPVLDAKEDPQGKFLYIITGTNVIKVDVSTFAVSFLSPLVNGIRTFSPKTIDFDSNGNVIIGASLQQSGVWIVAPNGTQLAFYDLGNKFSRVSFAKIDTFSTPSYSGLAIFAANQFPGLFKYELVCSCGPGYGGPNCTDIDECATKVASCGALATCVNTVGSYMCLCNAGFVGNGINCTEIDECALGRHNCDKNAFCTKLYGASFTCTCQSGFSGNGTSCEDIDECSLGLYDCPRNSFCNNTYGSYACLCASSNFTGLLCAAGLGTSCSSAEDCVSGFCVDGVCCNKNCLSSSSACSASRKGFGSDGICECIGGTEVCEDESRFSWSQPPYLTQMSEVKWAVPWVGVGGTYSSPIYFRTYGFEVIGVAFSNGSFVAHGVLPNGDQANGTKAFALDETRNLLYVLRTFKSKGQVCRIQVPEWSSVECLDLDNEIGETDIALDSSNQLLYVAGCTRRASCVQVIDLSTNLVVRWGLNITFPSGSKNTLAFDKLHNRLMILGSSSIVVVNATSLQVLPESPWSYLIDRSFFIQPIGLAFAESSQLFFISTGQLAHVYFANQTYFTSFDGEGCAVSISEENSTHVTLYGIGESIVGSSDGLIRKWTFSTLTGTVTLVDMIGQNPLGAKMPECFGRYEPKSMESWWCTGNGNILQEYNMSSGNAMILRKYGATSLDNPPSWFSNTNVRLPFYKFATSMDVGSSVIAVISSTSGLLLNKTNPNSVLSTLNFLSFQDVKIWTGSDGKERATVLTGWDLVQFPVSNPLLRVNRSNAFLKDGTIHSWYAARYIHVRAENEVHYIYLVDQRGVLKLPLDISIEPFTIIRRWSWSSYNFYGDIVLPDAPDYPIFFWLGKSLYRLLDNGSESQRMTPVYFISISNGEEGKISDVKFLDNVLFVKFETIYSGSIYYKYDLSGKLIGTLGHYSPSQFIFQPNQLSFVRDISPVVTEHYVYVVSDQTVTQFEKNSMSAIATFYFTGFSHGTIKSLQYTNNMLIVGTQSGPLLLANATTGKKFRLIQPTIICGREAKYGFEVSAAGGDGSIWISATKTGSISSNSSSLSSSSPSSVGLSLSSCSVNVTIFHLAPDFETCLGFLELVPGQAVAAMKVDTVREFLYVAIVWQYGCGARDNEVRKYRISDYTIEAIFPIRWNGTSPFVGSMDIDLAGNLVLGVKITQFGVLVMSTNGSILAAHDLRNSLSRIGTFAIDPWSPPGKIVLYGTYRYPAIFKYQL